MTNIGGRQIMELIRVSDEAVDAAEQNEPVELLTGSSNRYRG
jgi:hypothetical protein